MSCEEVQVQDTEPCSLCGRSTGVPAGPVKAEWYLCVSCDGTPEAEAAGYTHKCRQVVVGGIPRDADCSRARHGILFGLSADFKVFTTDNLEFGLPASDGSVPIFCRSRDLDTMTVTLAVTWIQGFCRGFLYRS